MGDAGESVEDDEDDDLDEEAPIWMDDETVAGVAEAAILGENELAKI